MNRNLDGTPLTREQLIELAVKAGMPRSRVARDVKTWVFAEASRALRHEMFWNGELNLSTCTFTAPALSVTVDEEMVRFLGGSLTATPEQEANRKKEKWT